tara:strand:- start:66438 stop:68186 length:1749 start_codon:yes stop_codon:yes gene_type:complete
MNKLQSKIFSLFTSGEKKFSIIIFFLLIVGMVLETFGVGLIIPFVVILIENDIGEKYPFIRPILDFIGNPSKNDLIFMSLFALIFFYFLKNIFLGLSIFIQQKFVYNVQVDLSKRLFLIYLKQPYNFHLNFNSAELQHNIVNKVAAFSGTITQYMYFIAEIMIVFGITSLLFILQPKALFVSLCIFLPPAILISLYLRRKISKWGSLVNKYEAKKILHVNQGLGAIKDIILMNRHDFFLNNYNFQSVLSANISAKVSTLNQVPRFIFEFLAVLAMSVIIYSLMITIRDMSQIVPLLAVFATAAFRMMPSFNRLLSSYQNIRYMNPVVETIFDELKRKSNDQIKNDDLVQTINFNKIILKGINFKYDSDPSNILKDLNIEIKKNQVIGLIGPTGSGKSTIINIICGLLKPSEGKILVDDVESDLNSLAWQNQIGYVSQSIYLSDDSIRKNIAFGIKEDEINDLNLQKSIKDSELEQFISNLKMGLDTQVGERGSRVSGGQLQRLGIARALYNNPNILVLDEATSSLDVDTEKRIMDSILKLRDKKTIIIVAHRYSTIENCDIIYKIDSGTVKEFGRPEAILDT